MDKKEEWRNTRGKKAGTDTEERESHSVCRERGREREKERKRERKRERGREIGEREQSQEQHEERKSKMKTGREECICTITSKSHLKG